MKQRLSGSDTYNGQEAGQIKDTETEEACLMWAPPMYISSVNFQFMNHFFNGDSLDMNLFI